MACFIEIGSKGSRKSKAEYERQNGGWIKIVDYNLKEGEREL